MLLNMVIICITAGDVLAVYGELRGVAGVAGGPPPPAAVSEVVTRGVVIRAVREGAALDREVVVKSPLGASRVRPPPSPGPAVGQGVGRGRPTVPHPVLNVTVATMTVPSPVAVPLTSGAPPAEEARRA